MKILRYKWIVVGVALGGVLLGMLQALSITPMFRSSAVLEILPGDPARSKALASQINTLRSRALAERVIKKLDIDRNPQAFFLPRRAGLLSRVYLYMINGTLPSPYPASTEGNAGLFLAGLSAHAASDAGLVEVSYVSPSPELAATMLDAAVREFINLNIENSNAVSLKKQLEEQQMKLEQSEKELLEFSREHHISGPGDLDPQRLVDLNSQLAAGKSKLESAKAGYDSVRNATTESFPASLRNEPIQKKERLLSALKEQLSDMSKKFGERWPGVIQLKQDIEKMEAELREEQTKALEQATRAYRSTLDERRKMLEELESRKRVAEEMNEAATKYKTLKSEADANRRAYDRLWDQVKNVLTRKPDIIRVIRSSSVPDAPYHPVISRYFFKSLGAGLAAGLVIAVVFAAFNVPVSRPRRKKHYRYLR
jgi:succinoglycan biosynthesis transport protein ExoP